MADILFAHEPWIRLGAFAAVFATMALWELMAPRRRQAIGRLRRWPGNLGVVVIDTLLVRLIFPTAAVGVALVAQVGGWGLLLLSCGSSAAGSTNTAPSSSGVPTTPSGVRAYSGPSQTRHPRLR